MDRYLVALAATAAMVLLRWLLDPWVGDNLPLVTLYGAIIVAVWYGGYGPGLVAVALGFLASNFLFMEPRGSIVIQYAYDYIGLALYLFTCSLIIGIGEAMRRAQRRASEEQELLRVTFASIGDALITTDTEGRITYLNAVAESLTGWTGAEAVRQPLDAVFKIVNAETRTAVTNAAEKALQEGVIVGLANHSVLIRKDGSQRPIDDSAAPIRDGQGHIIGCVLVFRDITARKEAEADLHRAAERIRSVMSTVVDAIITIDEQGIVDSFNPAAERLFGYPAAEVVGRNIKMLMPEPYSLEHDGYIANYLRTGVARIIGIGREVAGRRKDGSTFPMDLAVSEFSLDDGRRHFTGVARDISERKQAEQALQEADRHKDEFLAMLAHELRNPLAALRNAVQVMRLAGGDVQTVEKTRSMMERQVSQLVRLVNDLMDMSRVSQGKIELRKEPVELAVVLRSAVETSRPLIEQMGHELIVTMHEQPIMVDADPARLAQACMNLLNNAAKYTERGGQIWLTVQRRGREAVVSVKDSGIGIAAADLPRIFDAFTQLHRALDKAQGGLGIGLTLVKRLVEMHGGRIEARSEGPGRGSEFIVTLPMMREASRSRTANEPDEALRLGSSHRILIVDDNRDSADSLAMMLKIMGHDTSTAYDGREGIEEAERFRPDIVLLDIGLPTLNGYEACRCIRERQWGKNIIIVAVTGWGQEEDRRRSRDAGFDKHMVKPVDSKELMNLLAELDVVRH